MIEPIVYIGIGFLCAGLVGVAVLPLVRARAVRSTSQRLEAAIQALAKIQADKNRLRAEVAVLTRRAEEKAEEFNNRNTSHRVELGKKSDQINRLKLERNLLNLEIDVLHSEFGVAQESAPTKLPAKPGPVFLPLDTTQREKFATLGISQKRPQHAQRKTTGQSTAR
jgi:hypothetical protein